MQHISRTLVKQLHPGTNHSRQGRLWAHLMAFAGTAGVIAWTMLAGISGPRCGAAPRSARNQPKSDAVFEKAVRTLPAEARQELEWLRARVPSFQLVPLRTGRGPVTVQRNESLTIDELRGVPLDRDPPVLGTPPKYDPRMTDTFVPGTAPYEAKGIAPFRFKHFNCEFNYGGWHNFKMADYASAHGFNIIYPYVRTVAEGRHLPTGTQWLSWGGFIDWKTWFSKHGLPDGRYDLLVDRDLVAMHLAEDKFKRDPKSDKLKLRGDLLMIDMEHPVLGPDRLRKQKWYPKTATGKEHEDFEKKYYDGYAMTYISAVRAARKQGWKNISIYGWYPYGRTWGGLEKAKADPGTDIAWNAFGRQVFAEIDIVNNSVYCFYWTPENVAYTLANLELNLRMTGNRKPVRPYYWTLLHGGGGGWRWWRGLPLPNEDERAMIAMGFFTGFDGFDTWNWSGTGNHHRVKLSPGHAGDGKWKAVDLMVGTPFSCKSEAGAEKRFQRYDAIHVVSVDPESKQARFQTISKTRSRAHYGISPDKPFYRMNRDLLCSHIRPRSEPVAAMIEGMALVKPFEYILRHGKVKIDVPAQVQFRRRLPVVRRIKLGTVHVLITYDPNPVYGTHPKGEAVPPENGAPRRVILDNFDGVKGRSLSLPADKTARVFVLVDGAPRDG